MNRSQILSASLLRSGAQALAHGAELVPVNPELAVANFGIGIELSLKSRLAHDHWHLVVDDRQAKGQDCWDQLRGGELKTLGGDQLLQLLERILERTELQVFQRSRDTFARLARLRNKAAHFGIPAGSPEHEPAALAARVLRAWHALQQCSQQWPSDLLLVAETAWVPIQASLVALDTFLVTKADELRPHLKAIVESGGAAGVCRRCDHLGLCQESAGAGNSLQVGSCRVCGEESVVACAACPGCRKSILVAVADDGTFQLGCAHCAATSSTASVGTIEYTTAFLSPKDSIDHPVPLCSDCWGQPTQELLLGGRTQFVCPQCNTVWEDGWESVEACASCDEKWLGVDLEVSGFLGCLSCAAALRERMERD